MLYQTSTCAATYCGGGYTAQPVCTCSPSVPSLYQGATASARNGCNTCHGGCGCGCARSACCGDSPYGTQGNMCGFPTYARGQTAQNTHHSFCNPCLLAMLCCLM